MFAYSSEIGCKQSQFYYYIYLRPVVLTSLNKSHVSYEMSVTKHSLCKEDWRKERDVDTVSQSFKLNKTRHYLENTLTSSTNIYYTIGE